MSRNGKTKNPQLERQEAGKEEGKVKLENYLHSLMSSILMWWLMQCVYQVEAQFTLSDAPPTHSVKWAASCNAMQMLHNHLVIIFSMNWTAITYDGLLAKFLSDGNVRNIIMNGFYFPSYVQWIKLSNLPHKFILMAITFFNILSFGADNKVNIQMFLLALSRMQSIIYMRL